MTRGDPSDVENLADTQDRSLFYIAGFCAHDNRGVFHCKLGKRKHRQGCSEPNAGVQTQQTHAELLDVAWPVALLPT